MLPICDLSTPDGRAGFEARLGELRQSVSVRGKMAPIAAEIIDGVRRDGDEEIVRQMRRWADPDFDAGRIRVDPEDLARAERNLTGPLRDAIERAIEHVRAYQSHIRPAPPPPIEIGGAELGLRFSAVDSVGLHVPGGAAPLFSTLIMLAVPAQVAGVEPQHIVVTSPPPTRREGEPAGDISQIVLAVCHMLGIGQVYRVGGPAAFAALALGTHIVRQVDMIAGPSHPIGQIAKAQLHGVVGTDGFYGASEIVTVADQSAHAAAVASDLIAQAEHDPGKCFLVSWSRGVIDRIIEQIGHQLTGRSRRAAVESALRNESCAVLVDSRTSAIEVVNTMACEHVNLAVTDHDLLLGSVRHGGEIFLGDATPVAAGDYYAGPSHCLPTGGTARFASGVSVYTFLKRTGTVCYRNGMSRETIGAIACLAEAEELDGHAESVRVRAKARGDEGRGPGDGDDDQ